MEYSGGDTDGRHSGFSIAALSTRQYRVATTTHHLPDKVRQQYQVDSAGFEHAEDH